MINWVVTSFTQFERLILLLLAIFNRTHAPVELLAGHKAIHAVLLSIIVLVVCLYVISERQPELLLELKLPTYEE
jgi:hypothetical protein